MLARPHIIHERSVIIPINQNLSTSDEVTDSPKRRI